jgi:hypothetical protein
VDERAWGKLVRMLHMRARQEMPEKEIEEDALWRQDEGKPRDKIPLTPQRKQSHSNSATERLDRMKS